MTVAIETDDRRALFESLDRLLHDVVAPRLAEMDVTARFPHEVYRAMADLGLFALWIPERFGGLEGDLRTILLAVERIARVSPACALMLANCGDGAGPIVQSGSETVRRTYLPGIASGDVIPCFALTEPAAGSDAGAITTTAVRDGDGYRIEGRKVFCTNGSVGGVYVVFAKTDPEAGSRGITAFAVPRDAEGLSIGRDEDLIGLRGSPASEVVLEGVRVPEENRLGEEGQGFRVAMATLDEARLNAAAASLGIAGAAVEHAVAYARERVQFGVPVIQHQGLSFLLAEMTTELAAGWALFERALRLLEHERGGEAGTYAAMAKLFCTDLGMRAAVDAVQVFGGYGLSREFPVERLMRDAKAFQIFDGTNQIQKLIIGRHLDRFGVPVRADL